MNRIDARFKELKSAGRAAFIPFFTAGDPDAETTVRLMAGAEEAGADVIELGFPFSDPIADGPTIQASYTRVLDRGQHVDEVFAMVRRAREAGCRLPVVAMISYSIVFRVGFEEFLDTAVEAGLDGATIPDLPVEEAARFFGPAAERNFRLVCFITPATAPARRAMVAHHAAGFIYYISVRGITGARASLPPDLAENLKQLRSLTSTPVAVGFGISTPEQAAAVARVADGVVVGSAFVRHVQEAASAGRDAAAAGLEFIRALASAVAGPQ